MTTTNKKKKKQTNNTNLINKQHTLIYRSSKLKRNFKRRMVLSKSYHYYILFSFQKNKTLDRLVTLPG